MICVLVIARHTANAVTQLCTMVNCPSRCVLTYGCDFKGKGHHLVIRVWINPVLCWVR